MTPFFVAAGEIDEDVLNRVNPYVIGVSFFAVVFAGVAGSAYALYKEVCDRQSPPFPHALKFPKAQ